MMSFLRVPSCVLRVTSCGASKCHTKVHEVHTKVHKGRAALLLAVALFAAVASAQEPAKASVPKPEASKPNAEQRAMQEPTIGDKVAEESKEAAGEENAQFKQSASVKWLARVTSLPLGAAYWVFISLNFAIVALFIGMLLRSKLPGFVRTRGETIRASPTLKPASAALTPTLQKCAALPSAPLPTKKRACAPPRKQKRAASSPPPSRKLTRPRASPAAS